MLKLTDGLFREVFYSIVSGYSDVTPGELIVDAAAYVMVKNPENLQVLVMPNLYGDILSDLAAGMVGSLGLCGSAQIGDTVAVFEPVHGTAPDIAGRGVANPLGE
ncbi:MAG: isocitrate/isopropylmalate family dehydrogenase, partial [Desulfurococcaceae archaeon]